MALETHIPALHAKVGDWNYFVCTMRFNDVARNVRFAYELGSNRDLNTMIQRSITARTDEIKDYLTNSEHRFLGAMIVAVWGGEPIFTPIQMDYSEDMSSDIDREIGILTFHGGQQYFALDGQHRLKAIKDAIELNQNLGTDDICVILVPHFDTVPGRQRTRRLFTNINRNAKPTTVAENIVLDEDDGIAILTRRFVEEHQFLSEPSVTKIYTGNGANLKLARGAIAKSDPSAFTTISVLYDCLNFIKFDLDDSMQSRQTRPSSTILETSYKKLSKRVNEILASCGDLVEKFEKVTNARDLRAPLKNEGNGHALMRPVVQKAVFRTVGELLREKILGWDELRTRLGMLDWRVGQAPWTAVFNTEKMSMVSNRDFTNLLNELLRTHVAPTDMRSIREARKNFKQLKFQAYPYSAAKLARNLIKSK